MTPDAHSFVERVTWIHLWPWLSSLPKDPFAWSASFRAHATRFRKYFVWAVRQLSHWINTGKYLIREAGQKALAKKIFWHSPSLMNSSERRKPPLSHINHYITSVVIGIVFDLSPIHCTRRLCPVFPLCVLAQGLQLSKLIKILHYRKRKQHTLSLFIMELNGFPLMLACANVHFP